MINTKYNQHSMQMTINPKLQHRYNDCSEHIFIDGNVLCRIIYTQCTSENNLSMTNLLKL